MQISTKGNGNLVRFSGVSSYPGFKLTGLYCMVFLQISVKLILGVKYFKTEPHSVKEFHCHLTVQ